MIIRALRLLTLLTPLEKPFTYLRPLQKLIRHQWLQSLSLLIRTSTSNSLKELRLFTNSLNLKPLFRARLIAVSPRLEFLFDKKLTYPVASGL